MKVKKFYARNLQEGLQQIRKDMGKDAVIIESRTVRERGLKGIFKPRRLEILAALDRQPGNATRGGEGGENSYLSRAAAAREEEMNELKSMLQRLLMQNNGRADDSQEEKTVEEWEKHLEYHDISPELRREIMQEVQSNLGGEVKLNREVMSMVMEKKLTERITFAEEKSSPIQVFVGPTGVGKTTTLAKLAARYSIFQNEKVGLITIDHYRIGAVEQLRTYSEIVDVPLEVVMSLSDMKRALQKLEHCDRVLVDTAGKGTGNQVQIGELAGYIKEIPGAEIHLVVSATTRWQDVSYVAGNFSRLGYNRLTVTKIDETRSLGAVWNAVYYAGVPLVYLTNGQNVPDDLKIARELNMPSKLVEVETW